MNKYTPKILRFVLLSLFLIALLIFSFTYLKKAMASINSPVRILLVGDSITAGYYPCSLRKILSNNYTFVGRKQFNWESPPQTDCPVVTEGYVGYTTQNIIDLDIRRLAELNPDIIFIHLGSNDTKAGDFDPKISAGNIQQIIDQFHAYDPHAIIIVAKVITIKPDQTLGKLGSIDRIKSLNSEIGRMHGAIIIDLFDSIDPETDLDDVAHPNIGGAEKIAKVISNQINLLPNSKITLFIKYYFDNIGFTIKRFFGGK